MFVFAEYVPFAAAAVVGGSLGAMMRWRAKLVVGRSVVVLLEEVVRRYLDAGNLRPIQEVGSPVGGPQKVAAG